MNNLTKAYGDFKAVDDATFDIKEGEIVGLLGPNGAGKTTTINMVLGVLSPTSGKILLDGEDISADKTKSAGKMNFSAVYASVPPNLTIRQNLNVFGRLYDVKDLDAKIDSLLKEFDLLPFADKNVGVLSSGEQSRVNFAKAIINDPRLLLLDEPTASIDPSGAHMIREKIVRYAKEKKVGVLWTSHNMQEIEAVCDRVNFMSHGQFLLCGNPKTLPQEHGKRDLEELFISLARESLAAPENI